MRRDAAVEYLRGSLWAVPSVVAAFAVLLGFVLSRLPVDVHSMLAFQGTADDARALLIGIASTMVTVIALLLGLAVVALQLSSTQYSPRLLRNFLRDRPNQVVLGIFVGTFVYSAAGLFTVGVFGGDRVEDFPRLAVSVAVVLLFVSLALLVYFADHLAHSIQVDRIMRVAERNALCVVADTRAAGAVAPAPPPWAVAVASESSGYLQKVDLGGLAEAAARHGLSGVRVVPRVGDHVVRGTPLAWVWTDTDDAAGTAVRDGPRLVRHAVRLGIERTFEQDPGLGVRQLVDIGCKALSPAINDPYTAIQAIDHLAVIFSTMATAPGGDRVAHDTSGRVTASIRQRSFAQHLALGCGLLRRYGAREPTLVTALLRMLVTCAYLGPPSAMAVIEEQAAQVVMAAELAELLPPDLATVHKHAERLRRAVADRRADSVGPPADVPAPTPAERS